MSIIMVVENTSLNYYLAKFQIHEIKSLSNTPASDGPNRMSNSNHKLPCECNKYKQGRIVSDVPKYSKVE